MKYNKLVRDKITEIISKNGDDFKAHKADNEEYWKKLKEKFQEEVEEFNKNEEMEELADVLEVVEAICEFKNYPEEKIEKIKNKKAKKRGKFEERTILDEAQHKGEGGS